MNRENSISIVILMLSTFILHSCSSDDSADAVEEVVAQQEVGVLDNCTDIDAAYYKELDDLQQCTSDVECGTSIAGSNCGCTREIAIGLDRRTEDYFTIRALASTYSCSVDSLGSGCDCPEADGFRCVDNRCEWNYINENDR